MKKYNILCIIALLWLSSCGPGKNVVKADKVHESPYGSYISCRIKKSVVRHQGELLAIENNHFYIAGDSGIIAVPDTSIANFRVHFGREKNYGWFYSLIPMSFTHGLGMIFSLPINVITVTIIQVSAKNKYSIRGKNVPIETIRAFARFPQGMPSDFTYKPTLNKKFD